MKNNAISFPQPGLPAARPTVLIVDDSRLMRVAIKKILKDEFELIEAVDGEDAWSKLVAEPAVQCIFSDLSMPNLDGYGLLARVRGSDDAHIRSLPFIVITGKEGDLGGLLEEVRCHGATDLVGKPFKSDEIIARTRSLLEGEAAPAMTAVADTAVAEAPAVTEAPAADAAVEAAARRLREEQEAARQAEEALRRQAEEAARRQAAEEEARRQAAEAEARRIREEQEAARQAEEAARQAAEQAEQVRFAAEAAAEEARRQAAEAEARRIREEQEAERRAEEAARQAAEQAEQERLAAEAAARQAEEEARICAELRAKARRLAEERERQRQAEEQAVRFNLVQGLAVRLALPFLALANRLLRLGKQEQLEALRKRLP